ncbi:uncharacterized protein P884DRAFT_297046 [Thermothelomyces heterothallicus CBS 202.75]|uniref:uncharacterized protein n=1 Tax=Thermothelomyces heterothallicus CBS 202.75 TaxID=1149848 RepID=UPI003743CCFE
MHIPHSGTHEAYKLLLLSPEDVADQQTLARIRLLPGYSDHQNAAIVFLLHQQYAKGAAVRSAMQSFSDLQIKLLEHDLPLPIIPLTSPPDSDPAALLPTTLRAFQSGLASGRSVAATAGARGPAGAGAGVVVPAAAGLPGRAAETLSARWPSLRELLREMATEEGRGAVKDAIVGDEEMKEDGEAVVAFWQFEFATGWVGGGDGGSVGDEVSKVRESVVGSG